MITFEMDRPDHIEDEAPDAPLLVTPKKASALLSIPVQTLAVWRCRGSVHIPYVKMGRHVRYRMRDLLAFLESNRKGASQ